MSSFNWDGKGLNINGEWLNHLEFADDQVLIGKNPEEVQEMLRELTIKGKDINLKLNLMKCKYMVLNTDGALEFNNRKIEKVKKL